MEQIIARRRKRKAPTQAFQALEPAETLIAHEPESIHYNEELKVTSINARGVNKAGARE